MEVKAIAKFVRISPRKMRLVAGLVRGQKIQEALNQLSVANKSAATPIKKVIDSAVANATHNFQLAADNLFIKEIRVDGGPVLKRWLPRAHGRATPLRKRMSHVSVILGEIKDSGLKEGKKSKIVEPIKLGAAPAEKGDIKVEDKDTLKSAESLEKDKSAVNPRREGGGRQSGAQGFTSKIFRRKSG